MSEDVPERVEDYLELDQYIERLRLQGSAHLPSNLTPQQTGIYGMAKLFHTASPRVGNPRPEFKEQLRQRLLAQVQAEDQQPFPSQAHTETARFPENQPSTPAPDADHAETRTVRKRRIPFSRRALFTGGTVAAASLAAGAAIGASVEHTLEPQPNLNPHIRGSAWLSVAPLEQLGQDPIRFTTDTISGYVIRPPENTTNEPIVAFSAACTHLGCLVQWQKDKRQFPCPCHGRTFDATGGPVYTEESEAHYMSLPRLDTKIENGHIYVKVPASI